MGLKSNTKGKRGEREAAALLNEMGFTARRAQQYHGAGNSGDVIVEELPDVLIEVKFGYAKMDVGTQLLQDACDQAEGDAQGGTWVVLWKPPRKQWRASWLAWGQIVTVSQPGIKNLLSRMQGAGV